MRVDSPRRGAVRPLHLLLLALVAGGGYGVREYLAYRQRRQPLTEEWSVAFARVPTSGAEPTDLEQAAWRPLEDAEVLYRIDGEAPGDWFGYTTAALGDVDGDGVADFAVGAHQNENFGVRPAPNAPPGYVSIHSGATGERLHRLTSSGGLAIDGTDDHFGFTIANLDDVDGDGACDLAVGAYLFDGDDGLESTFDENTGGVFLFSGREGALLRSQGGALWGDRYGYVLDTVPDQDGDGARDLVVSIEKAESATTIKNAGSVAVVSSASFEELVRWDGPGWEAHLGSAVAGLPDLDGDGRPEVLAGAFNYAEFEADRAGRGAAGILSSQGQVLLAFEGERAGDHLGASVANVGDVDGDGMADVALGAVQSGWASDFSGGGFVSVRSSSTGRELWRASSSRKGAQLGWWVAPCSDRDGDGVGDLLVGLPGAITVADPLGTCGRLALLSGASGAVIVALEGLSPDDQFGTSCCEVDDLDGDGLREVLVGAPENVPGQARAGHALVLSGQAFAPGDGR